MGPSAYGRQRRLRLPCASCGKPRGPVALFLNVPERPTGTVTFLFTDIEGSTQLLHELRERYDALQSRHAEILRAAFAAHDGHEIDTQGDAFFAAFGARATPSPRPSTPSER